MSTEPGEQQIDVRNNRESRAASAGAMSNVARASDGGAPPRDAPEAGELPAPVVGGTAEGNPVAGVTISEADEDEAVKPDDGPVEITQR